MRLTPRHPIPRKAISAALAKIFDVGEEEVEVIEDVRFLRPGRRKDIRAVQVPTERGRPFETDLHVTDPEDPIEAALILAKESGIDVLWNDTKHPEWVEDPRSPEDAECPMIPRVFVGASGEVRKLSFYDKP